MKFSQKKFDNFEKLNSLSWPFWTLFFEKKMFYPHENQSKVLGYQGWDEILMMKNAYELFIRNLITASAPFCELTAVAVTLADSPAAVAAAEGCRCRA